MYQHNGVCFNFPESWEVVDDDDDGIIRAITIECPNDGYYSIDIYNLEHAPSTDSYIERSMKYFIKDLPFSFKVVGEPIRKIEKTIYQNSEIEGVQLEFTVRAFFIQEIECINSYFRIKSGNKVSFISSQYPAEYMTDSRSGFDLILSNYSILVS